MTVDARRAAEELHTSEERYRTLVEASPDAIITGDLQGRITFASRRALELYGAKEMADILGKNALDWFAPKDRPRFLANFQRTIEKGITRDIEYTFVREDGSSFVGEASAVVVRDAQGTPSGFLAVVRDTTARKRAEEALRQSHDELRAIYDGMFDGLMIWDRETWKIVRVNAALCGMTGYSESELLSMEVMDLHRKEDIPAVLEIIRARTEGRAEGVSLVTLLRKDGAVTPAEAVSNRITCEGNPCFATFFRDITIRRKAETALEESEVRIRTICDSALDAVVMVDSEGKALYWNPAAERMFGYTAGEMLGQEVHAILPASRHREQAFRGFLAFTASGEGSAVGKILELTAVRKDGREFPIEMSVSAFQILGQWCAAAIIRDVTERKKAREALERERRTLEHMLRASDHERRLVAYDIHDGLAQHLAGALMQFDVYRSLKQSKPGQADAVYEAGVAMLRQSHAEARRLISGLRPPILDEFGVDAAIGHLVHDLQASSGAKIEFRRRIQFGRLSPVLENTIYRIVQEALTNALKHSQSDRVCVTLLQRGDKLRMVIQDWGIGFVIERAREDRFGLKGIRERARMMGGKCVIRSSPGAGTSIQVVLPIVEGDADAGG